MSGLCKVKVIHLALWKKYAGFVLNDLIKIMPVVSWWWLVVKANTYLWGTDFDTITEFPIE